MADKPRRLKGQNGVLSLNAAIDTLNIAKEVSSIAPVNGAFSSTSLMIFSL